MILLKNAVGVSISKESGSDLRGLTVIPDLSVTISQFYVLLSIEFCQIYSLKLVSF